MNCSSLCGGQSRKFGGTVGKLLHFAVAKAPADLMENDRHQRANVKASDRRILCCRCGRITIVFAILLIFVFRALRLRIVLITILQCCRLRPDSLQSS